MLTHTHTFGVQVWTWGCNSLGCLGHNTMDQFFWAPAKLPRNVFEDLDVVFVAGVPGPVRTPHARRFLAGCFRFWIGSVVLGNASSRYSAGSHDTGSLDREVAGVIVRVRLNDLKKRSRVRHTRLIIRSRYASYIWWCQYTWRTYFSRTSSFLNCTV